MNSNCDITTPHCPKCPSIQKAGFYLKKMSCNGNYFRQSDSKYIKRWRCLTCQHTLSQATNTDCFKQHKRRINSLLHRLLCSGVSQRRCALVLRVDKKTIARKLIFLARISKNRQRDYLKSYFANPILNVQFDEMESFEHTKLKPLSLALAVSANDRKILGLQVSSMPAKGLLAAKSREKYRKRPDHRALGMKSLFSDLKPLVRNDAEFLSDKNPKYPGWLRSFSKEHEQNWSHKTVKGRRGCVTGQGELKQGGRDPLFILNHTCAMIRDNIKRLARKTWCTTKDPARLADLLIIYMDFHNRVLTV